MLPEKDKATAIGIKHKKFSEVRMCGFQVMWADIDENMHYNKLTNQI